MMIETAVPEVSDGSSGDTQGARICLRMDRCTCTGATRVRAWLHARAGHMRGVASHKMSCQAGSANLDVAGRKIPRQGEKMPMHEARAARRGPFRGRGASKERRADARGKTEKRHPAAVGWRRDEGHARHSFIALRCYVRRWRGMMDRGACRAASRLPPACRRLPSPEVRENRNGCRRRGYGRSKRRSGKRPRPSSAAGIPVRP